MVLKRDDDYAPRDTMPVPDPTKLTTDAVAALEWQLKELFKVEFKRIEDLMDTRFASVDKWLEVSERQRLEQKSDTRLAVDAALAAAKEQVSQQAAAFAAETAKTERNFTEQLKAQRDTFGTAIAGITTRYDDLKEGLTRIESVKVGGVESVQERRGANAALIAIVSVGVALVAAVIAVIGAFLGAR